MPALIRPPQELVPVGLAAMKAVALAAGTIRPGARRLIVAAQRLLLGTEIDLDAIEPITPEAFTSSFNGPVELKQQIVRGMCVLALVDGPPNPSVMATVSRFAHAVGVSEPALRSLTLFAEGHKILGTLDFLRRSHLREMAAGEMERGVLAAARSFLGLRGLVEDPLVAAPFQGLGDLPAGTLGRALFDHYRANGFAFPGEKGGFPESGVYHDLVHVLGGYGTDPLGELQVGGFMAGFRKKDPLFSAILPLLVFVADINVTPIGHDVDGDLFSKPGIAEAYLGAIARGGRLKIDLSDGWDFWPLMRKDTANAREELGLDQGSGTTVLDSVAT
ncbi:MAG: hypothetical protein JNL21_24790 [Myxococcales bacterium]|nr:hypothetical protein [Myxococcales bacterium]